MSDPDDPPLSLTRQSDSDEFSSWKEVASYVGVSVRRAQQWEKELGLPVERFNTGHRARVRAKRSEIDRWLRERTGPGRTVTLRDDYAGVPEPHSVVSPGSDGSGHAHPPWGTTRVRWVVAGALALATISLVIVSWHAWRSTRPAPPAPASAGIVDGELHVLDAGGHLLWRAGFPEGRVRLPAVALPPERAGLAWRTNTTLVHDIDGDGQAEVLFVLTTTMGNGSVMGNRLISYGADGTERWRYTPGRKTQWQGRQFDAEYSIWWVLGPVVVDGQPRLLVSASNAFFPCQISLLDAVTGRLVGEYWHFGALLSGAVLDTDGDGRLEAVVAGVNNPGPGNGSPALASLRLPLPPPTPDPVNVYDSPRPPEATYLLFPPVDIFAQDAYPASVTWLRLDGWSRLQLAVSLGHNYPRKGQVYYTLDQRLSVTDARPDDLLGAYHEDLRRAGQVDHRLDDREVEGWRAVRQFDRMPNANSPQVVSAWAQQGAARHPSAPVR